MGHEHSESGCSMIDIAHSERVSACCQRQIDNAQSLIRQVKKLQYYEIVRQLGVDMNKFCSPSTEYTKHVDVPAWGTCTQMARDALTKHDNCEINDELLVCLYTYHYEVKSYQFRMRKGGDQSRMYMQHYVICNVDAYDFDTQSECIYVPSYAGWNRVFSSCFHLPECMEMNVVQQKYYSQVSGRANNGWPDKIISIVKERGVAV